MAFTDAGSYLHTTEEVHIGGSSDPPVQLLVTGQIMATDNITAYYSSDIQLKENIRPIENAVSKVQQLSGIQFTWNEKSHQVQQDKGEDVGLIAQEVEKVLPEIVITRDSGIKAVNYDGVIPLLVEAIKEQQSTIENLKDRINKLEGQ